MKQTYQAPSEETAGIRNLVLIYNGYYEHPTELHPHLIWRPPTLPHRLQCSTIGRLGLNRRVRDGNGCVP